MITNEAGLFGAAGLIGAYLLFAYRGFKTAMLASDGFSKLLAAGLTAVLALQVFVIVGGVTRVIPLTGVTLPFVSYGGSSIVANMVLLALLLIVSDHARAERAAAGRAGLREPPDRPALRPRRRCSSRCSWASRPAGRCSRPSGLEDNPNNRRPLLQEQRIPRGRILASDSRTVLARSVPHGRGENRDLLPRLPRARPVRPPRRLLVPAQRQARPRAVPQRRADGRGGRVPVHPHRPRGPRRARATTWSPTWTWRPSAPRTRRSRAARARWWRSSRPPARSG